MYPIDIYKNHIEDKKVILVDFDNTICIDEWPFIGDFVPDAVDVIKKLQAFGHKIVLYTQRSYAYPLSCKDLETYKQVCGGCVDDTFVDLLTPAVEKCESAGIILWDINANSMWENMTGDTSRKVFSDIIIDDHNAGIPRVQMKNSSNETCAVVDWKTLDEWFIVNGFYKGNSFVLHGITFRYTQNEYGDLEIGILDESIRTYVAYITNTLYLGGVYEQVKDKSEQELIDWIKENTEFCEKEWKS